VLSGTAQVRVSTTTFSCAPNALVPQKSHVDMADEGVQVFAANGNLHSGRGKPGQRGGPVLAYRPDIELLADAVALAEGQPLGVIEFFPGEVAGWAAATNAVNLDTGEATPSVPVEIHDALVELKKAGYKRIPPRPRTVLRHDVLSGNRQTVGRRL
jgi:hypothetical protein